MTIGIIGAGIMGTALCQSFVNKDVARYSDIIIADKSNDNLKKLDDYGVTTTSNNEDALQADFIILAVKPQSFEVLSQEIAGKIPKTSTVISIMAGVPISKILKLLDHNKVARCMPNTAITVGDGVLAWYANENIDEEEKNIIQLMLGSSGYAFQTKEEIELDAITTVSGAGPGFFYYVMNQWIKASEMLPLDNELMEKILMITVRGSLKLAEDSDKNLEELKEDVRSKGGITEAGLEVLEAASMKETFEKMFDKAYKRCQELSK